MQEPGSGPGNCVPMSGPIRKRERGYMPMSNRSAVAQKTAIVNALKSQAKDQAVRQKTLVADAAQSELYSDDITGQVYKAYPVVLTEADFTKTANTVSTETTIGSYQVPNGIEYLFRAPKSNLDRNSPYLYGSIRDLTTSSATLTAGAFRIKVMDASQNDLKGQPFTGAISQINTADAIDWNKRLFFNCRKPIRAKAGDYILLTLNSASSWYISSPSTLVIQALELVAQT